MIFIPITSTFFNQKFITFSIEAYDVTKDQRFDNKSHFQSLASCNIIVYVDPGTHGWRCNFPLSTYMNRCNNITACSSKIISHTSLYLHQIIYFLNLSLPRCFMLKFRLMKSGFCTGTRRVCVKQFDLKGVKTPKHILNAFSYPEL